MVSTTQGSIKTRKPRKTAVVTTTKADAWVFATPDFSKFKEWDKIAPKDLQAGDYIASGSSTTGNQFILRVVADTSLEGSQGMATVETVWSSAKGGRSGRPRGIQWQSLYNRQYYRMFYPSAIPAPEPEPVEEVAAESPASTVALAGMDAGLVTLADVLRDNNKILCSVLAGISALHDEIRELKELCAEAWGAKQ